MNCLRIQPSKFSLYVSECSELWFQPLDGIDRDQFVFFCKLDLCSIAAVVTFHPAFRFL